MQKPDAWQLAEDVSPLLVKALSELELRGGKSPISTDTACSLSDAVRRAWSFVVDQARQNLVRPSPELICRVHQLLAHSVGISSDSFRDGTPPQDWNSFQQAIQEAIDQFGASDIDAWIVGQLYWGNHIGGLELTVAWLVINGIRLQLGEHPIIPDPSHESEFRECLNWAGPPDYDAEGLRSLFYDYVREQAPAPAGVIADVDLTS